MEGSTYAPTGLRIFFLPFVEDRCDADRSKALVTDADPRRARCVRQREAATQPSDQPASEERVIASWDEASVLRDLVLVAVPVVSRVLGIRRRWLRRVMQIHADALGPPRYRIIRGRRTRVLTLAEIATIQRITMPESRPTRPPCQGKYRVGPNLGP